MKPISGLSFATKIKKPKVCSFGVIFEKGFDDICITKKTLWTVQLDVVTQRNLGKLQSQDYIKKVRRIMAYTQIELGNIKELLNISTYSFNGNALDQSFVTMPQAPGNRGEYDILSCKSFFFSEV